MTLFIENKPLVQPKTSSLPAELTPLDDPTEDSKQFLATREMRNYIEGTATWTPTHQSIVSEDDQLLPSLVSEAANNAYLGEVIANLLKDFYAEEIATSKLELSNDLDWLPLKLSILGYQFSGKKTLATWIAKKYHVKLLQIDTLMSDLLTSLNDARTGKREPLSSAREALAKEIEACLFSGEDVRDECYVELIMNEIREIHPKINEQEFLAMLKEIQESDASLAIENDDNHPQLTAELQLSPAREDALR